MEKERKVSSLRLAMKGIFAALGPSLAVITAERGISCNGRRVKGDRGGKRGDVSERWQNLARGMQERRWEKLNFRQTKRRRRRKMRRKKRSRKEKKKEHPSERRRRDGAALDSYPFNFLLSFPLVFSLSFSMPFYKSLD